MLRSAFSHFLVPGSALARDFPDGLWPTTAVGLPDDYITDGEIGNRVFGSAQEAPQTS